MPESPFTSAAILGSGSFGMAMAKLLAPKLESIVLIGRDPATVEAINRDHKNPHYLSDVLLDGNVLATTVTGDALAHPLILFAVPTFATRDVARAHRVAGRVKAGIVWINDHHRLDPASPWGGVDDSGIGRECGTESFDDHFNTKSVMVATGDGPFDWYRDTAGQKRLN